MGSVRQYVLSIITAALVCSIVKALTGAANCQGKMISFLCGVFLVATLVTPLFDVEIPDLMIITEDVQNDAESITMSAQSESQTQLREIIKSETESYILDKAASMDAAIQVDVFLHEEDPIPVAAVISGNISPYNKEILSQYLVASLGISEDSQTWNSVQ